MGFDIRKCVLIISLVLASSFLFAQEQDEDYYADSAGTEESAYAESAAEGESSSEEMDLYYYNLPIVRIFTHPRGYYILYRTSSLKVATLCVPWEWISDYRDPRAIYTPVRVGTQPYISYITNNGEFYQIRINAPADSRDATWGAISSSKVPNENFDADTLTLKF